MVDFRDEPEMRQILMDGAKALGVSLDMSGANRLLAYVGLLADWNRAVNLSGIRDAEEMVSAHLLDCLAIVPLIEGGQFLDVGSGAGLPAFPVAVACPSLRVVSIDSRRRRVEFQRQAAHQLGLDNLEVVCDRVEAYRPGLNFDTLASRAFSSLGEFVSKAGPLCSPDGVMLAMKGAFPEEESLALSGSGFQVSRVIPVSVPGLDAERCIVVIRREESKQDLGG